MTLHREKLASDRKEAALGFITLSLYSVLSLLLPTPAWCGARGSEGLLAEEPRRALSGFPPSTSCPPFFSVWQVIYRPTARLCAPPELSPHLTFRYLSFSDPFDDPFPKGQDESPRC